MLSSAALLTTPDVSVRDLRCAHARGGWGATELARRSAIVFPRRGSFRRRGTHGDEVIEPGVAYFQRAGEEEEFAHPQDGGDRCTSIGLSDTLLAAFLAGDPTLPATVVPTTPHDDLVVRTLATAPSGPRIPRSAPADDAAPAHARLVVPADARPAALAHDVDASPAHARLAMPAHARPGALAHDVVAAEERVLDLVAHVLAAAFPKRVAAGRPATQHARRRAASDAREALAADPTLGLLDLARATAVSPHHLSRVFKAEVGVSITTYRRRLRLRAALERIDEGGLARVAADAGFADHAHLTREMRSLLGTTPSALQREIAGPLHQAG